MHIKFGDVLIGVAIIALAVLLLVSFRPVESGNMTAVIIKNNQEIKRIKLYDLKEPVTIDLKDETKIVIEAENGRIRFAASSCPDKTCIHTGWIDSAGDTAVCLPNRVLIKIIGEKTQKADDIDIIAE